MSKVIIIGAGGVGTVVAYKCAQNPEVFSEIVLASRTLSKCQAIVEKIGAKNMTADSVDADSVEQLVALFRRHNPDMVINVALPYQDLTIMDACLECGVSYLDTANYEPRDVAHFEYSWQWAYREPFSDAVSTRECQECSRPMLPSIISARWNISISSTAMQATMARLSPPTSIRRSTYARSRRTAVIIRTASG